MSWKKNTYLHNKVLLHSFSMTRWAFISKHWYVAVMRFFTFSCRWLKYYTIIFIHEHTFHWKIPTCSKLAYYVCLVKQYLFAGSYDIFYVAYVIHENLQSQCSQTIYHALFHLDSYKNWNTTNLTRISVERKMCHASEKIMRCDFHISKGRRKNTKKVS